MAKDALSDHELGARLDALEALYAHQERVVAELSDMVAQQWLRIDMLTKEALRLRDELANVSQRAAPEKPPPHY